MFDEHAILNLLIQPSSSYLQFYDNGIFLSIISSEEDRAAVPMRGR